MDGRTGKRTACVTRFAQAADGLARQADVDELHGAAGILDAEGRFKNVHVAAGVSDAVAEEDDALHAVHERLVGGEDGRGDGQEDRGEEEQWFHEFELRGA